MNGIKLIASGRAYRVPGEMSSADAAELVKEGRAVFLSDAPSPIEDDGQFDTKLSKREG